MGGREGEVGRLTSKTLLDAKQWLTIGVFGIVPGLKRKELVGQLKQQLAIGVGNDCTNQLWDFVIEG